MTTFEEFRDDVVFTLDNTPESVLRRVSTFDKGTVAQIAVPRQTASSRSAPWEGVKILPLQQEWLDRLLRDRVLVEEKRGPETIYALVQDPPAVPVGQRASVEPVPPPNLSEGAAITPNNELIIPFKQSDGIVPALNAAATAMLTTTDPHGEAVVTDMPITPLVDDAKAEPPPVTEVKAAAEPAPEAKDEEAASTEKQDDDKPASKTKKRN